MEALGKKKSLKKISLVGKKNMPHDGFPKLTEKDVAGSVHFKPFKRKKK